MSTNIVLSTKLSDTGSEPISTDQAKLHCAIDYTDYDNLIPIYISAARIAVEQATGYAIVEKTIKQVVNLYALSPFKLSFSPILQLNYVIPVNVYGCNGNAPYSFGANSELITVDYSGTYEIEYIAGYETVPADLKLAILQLFTFIFNHRGEYNEGKLDISLEAERIIMNNKRFIV